MADYYNQIKGLLTGQILGFSPEQRDMLDWAGYTEALELYRRTPIGERSQIVDAMRKIISKDEDWGLIADVIHLAYSLGISELRNTILEFRETKLRWVDEAWRGTIEEQLNTFLHGTPSKDQF